MAKTCLAEKDRLVAKEKACPAAEVVLKLEDFLRGAYDFRYNLLTDETEFRQAGAMGGLLLLSTSGR